MANQNRALQRLCIAGVGAATLIAGLPFVGVTPASAAHVAGIEFYSPANGAGALLTDTISSNSDGTDTTVRLLVDAPASVVRIDYSYTLVSDPGTIIPIASVTARPFTANFNTLAIANGTDIVLRAEGFTNANGTGTVGVETKTVTVDNAAAAVNVTSPTSSTGAPGTVGRFNEQVIVRGTTTAGFVGSVDIADILGTNAGPSVGVAGVSAVVTNGTFAALVPTFSPTSANAYIRADIGDTDETELASVYEQTVATPALTSGNPAVAITAINDAPGDSTDVTVTVLDTQNGRPVGDAIVELDLNQDGDSLDVLLGETSASTDVNGQVTFTVDDFDADGAGPLVGGTRQIDFNVNQTQDLGFNSGVGDKRTTITQTTAEPAAPVLTAGVIEAFDPSPSNTAPGSVANPTSDFPAGTTTFDTAEDVDTRVRLTDQTGDGIAGQQVFGTVVFTPEGGAAGLPVPFTGTSDADGYVAVPVDDDAEGTYRVTAYVNRDNDLAQTPADLVLAPITFTFDGGQLFSSAPSTSQAEAASTATRTFTYRLDNGTVLPGRVVDLELGRNVNVVDGGAIFSATQPAGTTRLNDDTAYAITNANGQVSASVTDPVTDDDPSPTVFEQQEEDIDLNAEVRDTAPLRAASTNIEFIVGATPAEVRLLAVNELVDGAATPGRPVELQLNVDTVADAVNAGDTGTDLGGVPVTLSVDKGYFTSRDNPGPTGISNDSVQSLDGAVPATTPTAGAPVGAFRSDGQQNSLVTGTGGNVRFSIAIDRDVDFDDDGRAVVNVTATAGSVTRVIPVTFFTDETGSVTVPAVAGATSYTTNGAEPLNPASTNALEILPVEGQDVTEVSSNAPDPGFLVRARDAFGNLVGVDFDVDTAPAGTDVNYIGNGITSFTNQETPDLTAESSLPSRINTGPAQTETQTITVSKTFNTLTFQDANPGTPAFDFVNAAAPGGSRTAGSVVATDSATVSYYTPVVDQFTYTFASTPGNTVTVGSAVNTVVTVKDQNGNPVQGLNVDFVRSGPGEQAGGDDSTTNADGQAGFTFTSPTEGRAVVTVIITDGNNIELSRGVQNVDFIQAAQGTSVSIDATPLVRWPGAPVITGVLRNAAGDPLPGRVVNIIYKQQAVAGLAAFRPVLRLTTDANGVYRGSIRPTVNAVWQAIYLGNNAEGASGSAYDVTKVQVANPTVNGFGTTLTVRSTRTVNFSGIVTPGSVRHPVVVQWIRTDGIFNLTAPKRADAVGNYVTGRTFAPGTYRLRVLGVNTANNVASASRTVTLRVVR